MEATKITEGPWFVHTKRTIRSADGEADRFESGLYSGDGIPARVRVANLEWGYGRPEDDANARAIAAVPTMIEAMTNALDRLDLDDPDGARLALRAALRAAGVRP